MQSIALSVAEKTEQQDPEIIHLSRQYSLKKKYTKKKKHKTYTLTPTSFSFSTLILPLTSLPISGALGIILWHSKQL